MADEDRGDLEPRIVTEPRRERLADDAIAGEAEPVALCRQRRTGLRSERADRCRLIAADRLDLYREHPGRRLVHRLGLDQRPRHFERVLPAHLGKASGAGTSRRVAFVDAVHILVEPHAFGAELAGEEHRREIGAAAAEQATLAVPALSYTARHAYEPRPRALGPNQNRTAQGSR